MLLIIISAVLMFGGFGTMTAGLGGNNKLYFSGVGMWSVGLIILLI